jgi:hypothetical protein
VGGGVAQAEPRNRGERNAGLSPRPGALPQPGSSPSAHALGYILTRVPRSLGSGSVRFLICRAVPLRGSARFFPGACRHEGQNRNKPSTAALGINVTDTNRKAAVGRCRQQSEERLRRARRAKGYSPRRQPWVVAWHKRSPGIGAKEMQAFRPVPGLFLSLEAAPALTHWATFLRAYRALSVADRFDLDLSCGPPQGERPLLSKRLQARRLDSQQAFNCRFGDQRYWHGARRQRPFRAAARFTDSARRLA